jgi:exodeoxyribonuclease-3
MAFRKKAMQILEHKPDIVVVPECEHPDKLNFNGCRIPNDVIWYGDNLNKGLGIFSYSDYTFRLHECYNSLFKTVVPIEVSIGKKCFNLFAIWANNPADHGFQYVGQVWKAVNFYKALLKGKKTLLVGDFNSNTIWDKPRREGNHSAVVKFLSEKNIHSVYHTFFNQEHGQEKQPTFYLYRHKQKSYHIDYCFASADFARRVNSVEVGLHRHWTAHSDHSPLIVDFKN